MFGRGRATQKQVLVLVFIAKKRHSSSQIICPKFREPRSIREYAIKLAIYQATIIRGDSC
jgi:hypothetical protein